MSEPTIQRTGKGRLAAPIRIVVEFDSNFSVSNLAKVRGKCSGMMPAGLVFRKILKIPGDWRCRVSVARRGTGRGGQESPLPSVYHEWNYPVPERGKTPGGRLRPPFGAPRLFIP
ncbi:MAG: hypothetical protein M9895_12700 [Aquamicrobium sp.]|uniref:hypothetical protein n=1 Tax=Aquamicrobium sp. TaxID=1872579 RepID=UPI00349ECED8|nr:hypothetical protein [Aquamicrobium sp.]